jgi:methylenetetrahydrofolate reductase (NADPH)
VPGILPVENFGKMLNFAARCQASVPAWMHKAFGNAESPEAAYLLSVAVASEQCTGLAAEGVEQLHLYTLNNPDLAFDVCRAIGYAAAPLAIAEGGAA